MGRLAEYSEAQIIEAGKYVESVGQRVTAFSIREKLGGGSPERIKIIWEKHLNTVKAQNPEESEEEKIELPAEIQESLNKNLATASKQLESLAKESFKVAMDVAESRVKNVILEHEEKISQYAQAELEAFQALEKSDREKEEFERKMEALATKNEQLLAENSKLLGNIESLQSRISQLETKESELSELQREFGKLQGKIEVMESNA